MATNTRKNLKREKYTLRDELRNADQKFTGDPSIEGKGILTFSQYINSMRSTMFASHLNQFKNQLLADFPGFFTGAENLVGKYSSGYKRVDESVVYRKVTKFEGLIPNPTVYKLFTYNVKRKRYEIYDRKECESLVEVFGFSYDNKEMDKYQEGDHIEQDTILYRSKSYDEFMNYCYGKDALLMLSTDPFTAEDAGVASSRFAEASRYIETDEVVCTMNDNDFPINLYGDETEYKVMPDIGEDSNGIVIATRRKFNNQVLYDFKEDMLSHVENTDTKYYTHGKVWDIDIYMNNEEFKDNSFYHQVYTYWLYQNQYYRELKETCEAIMESGEDYSPDIDYCYKRAVEQLDLVKKWKDKDTAFSNLQLHIHIIREDCLGVGQKTAGRCGNKSVISQVRPTEEMPYIYDGNGNKKYIDVIFPLHAIINRTTAAPLFEIFSNFIGRRIGEAMQLLDKREDKEALLFDVLEMFNPKYKQMLWEKYENDSEEGKEEFLYYCEHVKIHFNQPSMEKSEEILPIFYRLDAIRKKYAEILAPDDVYIQKFGREIKCWSPSFIGNMYLLILKQTAKKGFSVRGIGAVNSKGIPERSYKSKSHRDLYSSTAIRFGESETLNFSIGMSSEEVALFHAFYRTSVKARKDIGKALLSNKSVIDVPKTYDSRVAQFFDILFESLGFELTFVDTDDELLELDNKKMQIYTLANGKEVMCTAFEKFIIDRRNEIAEELLEEYGIMSRKELEEMIDEEIEEKQYLMGELSNKEFYANCTLADPHIISPRSSEEILSDMEMLHAEVNLDE